VNTLSGRQALSKSQCWVVKIGSALLTNDGEGLDKQSIAQWVEQLVWLRQQGIDIVLVSSGSVAEGITRLGLKRRPKRLHELQAAAAVGQMGLIQTYETEFKRYGLHAAQILLTHDDLSDRKRYLNARGTLKSLLGMNVIPIVNENDTVVTDEIKFGDNDTLGALVANLIEADALVILTDQDGLYNKDPRKNTDAVLLDEALAEDASLDAMAAGGVGALGRGGMVTKVRAARLAARSGAQTVIVGGRIDGVLRRLRSAEKLGTLLLPNQERQVARKQWLAGHLQTRGKLVLDAGAVKVLRQKGRSLLPVGVKSVSGRFRRGEMVACVDGMGNEVARGLVAYDFVDAEKIIGQPSDKIESILGYVNESELVHRDNLVLV